MQVDFYQLGRSPIERVLPRIAQRVTQEGGRLLIVSADEAQLAALDASLWIDPPDSFLPHAIGGQSEDAAQPVLLSVTTDAPNDARTIAIVDGAWRDEALTFDRALHFFDETSLMDARTAWRSLAEREGVTRNFWRQDDASGWEKVA